MNKQYAFHLFGNLPLWNRSIYKTSRRARVDKIGLRTSLWVDPYKTGSLFLLLLNLDIKVFESASNIAVFFDSIMIQKIGRITNENNFNLYV